MANGLDVDLPLPAPSASTPSLTPIGRSYPSHAIAPEAIQPRPVATPAGAPGTAAQDPFGTHRRSRLQSLRKRIGSMLAAIVALIAKFFAAIKGLLLLLPKAKLLVTAGTALVSVAAYSIFFGWEFAAGFVVLLFLHEMGHVIALRREGIKASAPMFIPFMGAMIFARSLGDNALAEARVGLAGPILGSIAAALVAAVGELTGSSLLIALAYFGFFINLFNLLPVVPLDGGRAMAAMAPWMWFLGFGALVALAILQPGNPILLIIVIFAGYQSWHRWQQRRTRSLQQAAYYRVAPRARMIVGAVYIGLIVLLVFGMSETHVLTSGGHSFGSL